MNPPHRRTSFGVRTVLDRAREIAMERALLAKNATKPWFHEHTPGFLLRKLAEEVGEVAEALILRDVEHAILELGDVLWTATMLLALLEDMQANASTSLEAVRSRSLKESPQWSKPLPQPDIASRAIGPKTSARFARRVEPKKP
jgi:NTP pyrophosphatase (non-canonical NTP hydrolase)